MSVQVDVAVSISGQYNGSNALAAVAATISRRDVVGFSPGTGVGQADKMYAAARTVASAANDDIDLAGVLTDVLGVALTFVGVKAIYIRAADANVNDLVIGPAPTNGFLGPFADATDRIRLRPGEMFLITNKTATGWVVTPSTGDLLRVTNGGSGSTVSYDVIIIGDSA